MTPLSTRAADRLTVFPSSLFSLQICAFVYGKTYVGPNRGNASVTIAEYYNY